MAMTLNSPAFTNGRRIPDRYSKDGENLSPPVEWDGAPADTLSYVLVVEDPDAPKGTFRHWAAYDIPAGEHGLAEGAGSRDPGIAIRMAVNDFGNQHYDGPRPPSGHGVHHYHFRLAALDVLELELAPNANAADVWSSARPHVLAETELVGTYER
jgi:Raf kinase inhibitor-like YbhB/YbcL family protein